MFPLRDRSSVRSSRLTASLPFLMLFAGACGDPEASLVGCWEEVEWTYERSDDPAPERWTDGVRSRAYPDRQVLHHHAEWWSVGPRGQLQLALSDGSTVRGRWRLKGRGHVLTLRYPRNDTFEVYDIKELDDDELVLQYDMGMEVRGIARLRFRRRDPGSTCVEERS